MMYLYGSKRAWAHMLTCLLLLEVCFVFALDQQEIVSEKPKSQASLGDVFGAMGGLMTAFAPQKDAEAIKNGVDVLSIQLESLLKSMASLNENLADVSEEVHTLVGDEWKVVKVKNKGHPFDVPEGFEIVEMDEANLFEYLQYLKRSMEEGTIKFVKKIAKGELVDFDARSILTSNTTNIIDDTNFEFEISFPWPIGAENLTHAEVILPGGKENVYVWTIPEADQFCCRSFYVNVIVIFKNHRLSGSVDLDAGAPIKYSLSRRKTEKVVFKVEDNKIVKINNNLNGMLNYGGYLEGKWKKEHLQVVQYMASLGVLTAVEHPVRFDWNDWNPKTIQQMVNLVHLGIVKKIEYINYINSLELILSARPLLSITTGYVRFEDLVLNCTQWQEVGDSLAESMDEFVLSGGSVDRESGSVIAKMCSRQKGASIRNVLFEDIDKFIGSFEKHLGEGKGNCEELVFYDDDCNDDCVYKPETIKIYINKIRELAERLGWVVQYEFDTSIYIKKK